MESRSQEQNVGRARGGRRPSILEMILVVLAVALAVVLVWIADWLAG